VVKPPYLWRDGWLWCANGRLSRDGQTLELFPPLREGATAFAPFQYLEPYGSNAVIAADANTVWLLDL
jgi:hypothetical protein